MIKIEFPAFNPSDSSDTIKSRIQSFETHNQEIWNPFNQKDIQNLITKKDQEQKKYSKIILCGIGGSALGPKMLREALNLKDVDFEILENIDPDLIIDLTSRLNLNETLFLFVSKSGGTPETLAQYLYFKNLLQQNQKPLKDHMMIITDPEQSVLLEEAQKFDIPHFPVPQNVGGRFSIQTCVGMIPLWLMGGDVENFQEGFKKTKEQFYSTDSQTNISYRLAEFQHKTQKPIQVIFPYSSRLKLLGEWYAQLLGESVGKINKNGQKVGLTPFSALGTTDQHSQVQLWTQGPEDKAVIFVELENFQNEVIIPEAGLKNSNTDFMIGKSFNQLIGAEQKATEQALIESNVPTVTIKLERLNAQSLGELVGILEGSVIFLGEMLEVNTFNQPGVERGKVLTRERMKETF